MDSYQKQLVLSGRPEAVFAALATTEGLRGWWTRTCDVAEVVGGRSTFRFGPHRKVMEIEALEPGREVRWRCVGAHLEVSAISAKDEWVGTRVVFALSPGEDGRTVLDFVHEGLSPAMECYEICRDGWETFLGSLRSLVETGAGRPFGEGVGNRAKEGESMDKGNESVSDQIKRSVEIEASRSRVWRALTDAEEFGAWFGVDLKGQRFEVGRRVRGPITIEGYTHVMFDVVVERCEPEREFAFRWHPYAVDPAVDYSKEKRTLVTFTLEELAPRRTLLTAVESGFDDVPPERRFEAFRMNSGGWTHQMENLRAHAESR